MFTVSTVRALLIALAVAVVVGAVAYTLVPVAEDDRWFNCHLHGNGVCGDTPGPLGFTNLFGGAS